MLSRALVLVLLSGCSVGNLDLDGKAREQAEEDQWPDDVAYLTSPQFLDVERYAEKGVSLFAKGLIAEQTYYDSEMETNQLLVPATLDQPFYRHARRKVVVSISAERRRQFSCEAATVGYMVDQGVCVDRDTGDVETTCGDVAAKVVGRGGVAPCPMADNAYRVYIDAKGDRLWMSFHEVSERQELVRLSAAYSGGWKPMSQDGAPGAIVDPAAFVTGGKVLLFGRAIAGGFEGGLYDPKKDQWAVLPKDGMPSGGGAFQILWIDGKLYVFQTSGGAIFDPDAHAWRALKTENAPSFGESFVAAYDHGGNRVFLYGVNQGGAGTSFSVGAIYDVASDRWIAYPVATGPQAATLAGAAWTGTELLVWSDKIEGRAVFYPQTGQWVPFEDVNSEVAHASTGVPNRVYNVDGKVLLMPSGQEYDPRESRWSYRSATTFLKNAAIQYDRNAVVAMGTDGGTPAAGFDLTNRPIMFPNSPTTPETRPGAAVAKVGDHLLVYGGCEKKVNDRCQVFSRLGAVVKLLPYK